MSLNYRGRDDAAIIAAISTLNPLHVTIERETWMVAVQSVSPEQATLLKTFLPHPADMQFCALVEQVVINPVRDLRGVVRALRNVAPTAPRQLVGEMILDLGDEATFRALFLTLNNPFELLSRRCQAVLLDVAC